MAIIWESHSFRVSQVQYLIMKYRWRERQTSRDRKNRQELIARAANNVLIDEYV